MGLFVESSDSSDEVGRRKREDLEGRVVRAEVSELSGQKEVEVKGEDFRLVFETDKEYKVGEEVEIKFIYEKRGEK